MMQTPPARRATAWATRWLASGSHSPAAWLAAHTSLSPLEARRLVRVAALCASHPGLAEAVVSGALSLGRADTLARAVTEQRAPFLAASLPALLRLGTTTPDDDDIDDVGGGGGGGGCETEWLDTLSEDTFDGPLRR